MITTAARWTPRFKLVRPMQKRNFGIAVILVQRHCTNYSAILRRGRLLKPPTTVIG